MSEKKTTRKTEVKQTTDKSDTSRSNTDKSEAQKGSAKNKPQEATNNTGDAIKKMMHLNQLHRLLLAIFQVFRHQSIVLDGTKSSATLMKKNRPLSL